MSCTDTMMHMNFANEQNHYTFLWWNEYNYVIITRFTHGIKL